MTRIDVHQHLWSEPLVEALQERNQLPFIRRENGLTVLYLRGERPYVIDLSTETPAHRGALLERDGVDRALVCLSSPLGIEWLAREQSLPLLDAFHRGALALDEQFGVWGAIPLERPDPADVERALGLGCVGISLPAGALGSVDDICGLYPILDRLELLDAPLLVHPGPGAPQLAGQEPASQITLHDPLWWPALTRYVASMQAAWMAFLDVGRARHPGLRVIFSMLAGLAPLQHERLASRGCPTAHLLDELTFYDTSSYGPATVERVAEIVGAQQLLYGSDRPVVDPGDVGMPAGLDWEQLAADTDRALTSRQLVAAR
jgi:hypothetical protein